MRPKNVGFRNGVRRTEGPREKGDWFLWPHTEGPTRFDVRKILETFLPHPPCVRIQDLYYKIHATSLTSSAFADPSTPILGGRHMYLPPNAT